MFPNSMSRRTTVRRSRCPVPVAAGLLSLCVALGAATSVRAQEPTSEPLVGAAVQPLAVTVDEEALKGAAGVPGRVVPEGEPLPTAPPPARAPVDDSVSQILDERALLDVPPPGLLSEPDENFAGLDAAANPPDTVGDIGADHFVQMVNATQFQIFAKDGTSLLGPAVFGNLWPLGDICRSNTGDPIVVYDHLADRWLLSQFAFPSHMCIAISQTPDPTAGTWFLYTFDVGVFPDYPKFGVWPDGYYMSSFEGGNLGVFAFDRANMVLGNAASFLKTTIASLGVPAAGVRRTRILPSDLDGPPPPNGTPNFFVRTVDDQQDPADPTDRIEVYEFAVDWTTLTFGFTLVDTLTPAPFQIMLCDRNGGGTRDCVPQPDTDATVDALSNRPMMQLKYRRFGGEAAMVFNQTIDVSGSIPNSLGIVPVNEVAGVRWYELRQAGAGWGIEQQGTFAAQPIDAAAEEELLHRWMGSAVIDKDGNIALGYSIGNDDDDNEVFPGIAYTGRRFDDVPGLMPQGEFFIREGIESQTGGARRWGDYSAMSVDPIDDCTFWYTNHIAGVGGFGARPTQIASFRFDTCGTDLAIDMTAAPSPAIAGDALFYEITVTNNGPLDATEVLVFDSLPAGVTFVTSTQGCVLVFGTILVCPLGDIAVGDSAGFTVEVAVDPFAAPTAITNTARVSADQADIQPDNNEAQVATIVDALAALRIAKLCKPDGPAPAGEIATCTIFVDNLGASGSGPVDLVDTHVSDAAFEITSATTTQGACGIAGRVVDCGLGNIGPGDRVTVTVELTSDGDADVNNLATVDSATPDPDNANNQAEGSVSFFAQADLWMEKTSTYDHWRRKVRFRLTARNDPGAGGPGGPSDARNVVVTDPLPLDRRRLRVVSLSPGCSYSGATHTVTCLEALLPFGSSVSFEIEARVRGWKSAAQNTATVSSSTADPNLANNTDSAPVWPGYGTAALSDD